MSAVKVQEPIDASAIRRVITGHDSAGRSVFTIDEIVAAKQTPAFAFCVLWGSDQTPMVPVPHDLPDLHGFYPPVGGVRFMIGHIPPAAARNDNPSPSELAALDAEYPDLVGAHEDSLSGMHTTDTIDFAVILSGECVVELDHGATVRLGPGDTLVQSGTRHRWSNPGLVPCVFAVVLLGAARDA